MTFKKILSLMFFLIMVNFVHAAAPAKHAQSLASTHNKKVLDEVVYQAFKHTIKDSDHRVKDWKKFSQLHFLDQVEQTNCYNAARTVITTLRTEDDEDLYDRLASLRTTDTSLKTCFDTSIALTQTEFHGEYYDFIVKGNSQGIAENLFNKSTQKEHLVFYIAPNPWKHAYVVQKVSDGKNSQWRVMQSFFAQFSLAEWLGIDPWNKKADQGLTLLHQRYGNGKVLTHPNEVRQCLKDHFGVCSKAGKKDYLYVRMFKVE